ncbi:MAG TPA: cytochrome-c oxidase [Anaerolineae bacterium]
MILIEITNISELVKQKKGAIASIIGPFVKDVEAEVEKVIIEQIKEKFAGEGVKANIISVTGVNFNFFVFGLDTEVEETDRADGEEN